ncbi:MAG: hypothetical protein U0441_06820 [Polyangiaceae bacterium]
MNPETLAPDIAWEPSGHLSEVALTALADGEDALLSPAMHAHLEGCDACAMALGAVAMRSADLADALRDPATVNKLREVAAVIEADRVYAPPDEARQSVPNDVRQSVPNDVRQSLPESVVQVGAIGVAPSWVPPVSVRAPKNELVRTRKVPWGALVPAFAVAALGAFPSLLRAPAQLAETWSVLRDVGPAFLRLAPSALAKAWGGPRGTAVVIAVWMLAGTLVAAGLGIAKQQSKKLVVDGGR